MRRSHRSAAAAPTARPAPRATTAAGSPDSRLPRYPDLLGGPLLRPLDVDEVVVARILGRVAGTQLVQRLDRQSVRAQKRDPVAVREVVLDPERAVPVDLVHP